MDITRFKNTREKEGQKQRGAACCINMGRVFAYWGSWGSFVFSRILSNPDIKERPRAAKKAKFGHVFDLSQPGQLVGGRSIGKVLMVVFDI